jgi:hypothetical protein
MVQTAPWALTKRDSGFHLKRIERILDIDMGRGDGLWYRMVACTYVFEL